VQSLFRKDAPRGVSAKVRAVGQSHGGLRAAAGHLSWAFGAAIKQSADGERELVMRSWGFVLLRDG